ncbi:PEP-CTERM sorting domain-containing protein [Mucisphaera calidilacus]|nr:PEP-CTERM sorting domain-containing protein [Mucisphaera calidilacus]
MALAAIAVAGLTVSASADMLLFSFEDGVEGWEYTGWNAPGSIAVSPLNATEGAQSLAVTVDISGFSWTATIEGFRGDTPKNPEFFDAMAAVLAQEAARPGSLAIAYDITYDPATIPGGTFLNNSFSLQGPDFRQIDGVAVVGLPDDLAGGPVTITVQEPLSTFVADPASGFYRLTLGVNGDWGRAPMTMYLDNVRIVPEPASLGLLGLGGLALLRRR